MTDGDDALTACAAYGVPTSKRIPPGPLPGEAFTSLLARTEHHRLLGFLGAAVRDGAVVIDPDQHVELAWRLPYTAKVNRGSGKRILRQVLDRYVPRHLVERPKMGFDPPIDTWLRGPLRGWAADLLDPRELINAGIDPAPVRSRWAEHQAGARNHGYALWTVLMYQSWRDTL